MPSITSPRHLTLGVAALLAAAAPATAQVPGMAGMNHNAGSTLAYSPEALESYNQFVAQWVEAWHAGDERRAAGFYSAGAAVALGDGELVRGRDAVQQALARIMRSGTELRLAVTDFVSGGDLLSATGAFVLENGDSEAVSGQYVMILRLEGGRWKIRSQIFTPSLALGAAPQGGPAQ